MFTWLAVHGRPIRYGYVEHPGRSATYQNVYATEPGSAEMPSAGRPFTPEVITRLVAKGVGVDAAGAAHRRRVARGDELPYPERLRVPATTASRVNDDASQRRTSDRGRHHRGARLWKRRPTHDGVVQPFDGWTDLVITPERGVQRRRRAADRLARARGVAPADARGGRRPRAARGVVRGEPATRATCGTSSATCT